MPSSAMTSASKTAVAREATVMLAALADNVPRRLTSGLGAGNPLRGSKEGAWPSFVDDRASRDYSFGG